MTAQSQELQLLPCPFCGEEANRGELVGAFAVPGGYKYDVHCRKCLATNGRYKTQKEADTAWNCRHPPTPQGKIEWPEALKTFDFNTQAYDRGFNHCRDMFMKIILERGIK